MFVIRDNQDKTSIKEIPFFAFGFGIAMATLAYYGWHYGSLTVSLIGALFLVLSVLHCYSVMKEILVFDWQRNVILYGIKFGENPKKEIEEIPLKNIEIHCFTHISITPQGIMNKRGDINYAISFSLSDASGKRFPLYCEVDYREGMKLVHYFYNLHEKGILELNNVGQILAKNPARYPLFIIAVILLGIYLGVVMALIFIFFDAGEFGDEFNKFFHIGVNDILKGVLYLIAFLLFPFFPVALYAIIFHWHRSKRPTLRKLYAEIKTLKTKKSDEEDMLFW